MINKKSTFSTNAIQLINENNSCITYSEHISINILPKLASKLRRSNNNPLSYVNWVPLQNLVFNAATHSEIKDIFLNLKNTGSGYDIIKPIVLKSIKDTTDPLQCFINASINQGILPSKLKFEIVVLIFKHGNKSEVKNYILISIQSVFSKIF